MALNLRTQLSTIGRFCSKPLVAIALILGTSSVVAGGWQGPVKVTSFIIEGTDAGERVYVQFSVIFNPDSCTNPEVRFTRLNVNTAKGRAMFSSIVTAKALNQTIVPIIDGCDDWNRPILQGLRILD